MTIEFYEDKSGEWRWRAVADNGRIMATGAEGYNDQSGAEQGFRIVAGHITANNIRKVVIG